MSNSVMPPNSSKELIRKLLAGRPKSSATQDAKTLLRISKSLGDWSFKNFYFLMHKISRKTHPEISEFELVKTFGEKLSAIFTDKQVKSTHAEFSLLAYADSPFDFALTLKNSHGGDLAVLNFSLILNEKGMPQATLGNMHVKYQQKLKSFESQIHGKTLEFFHDLFLRHFGKEHVLASSPKLHFAYMYPAYHEATLMLNRARENPNNLSTGPELSKAERAALHYLTNNNLYKRNELSGVNSRKYETVPHSDPEQREVLQAYHKLRKELGRIRSTASRMHISATRKSFEQSKSSHYWRAK